MRTKEKRITFRVSQRVWNGLKEREKMGEGCATHLIMRALYSAYPEFKEGGGDLGAVDETQH